jgi:uncharacterized membrane protein YjgN (DUF898 family)
MRIEVVSQPRITVAGKAQADSKAQQPQQVVSTFERAATQPPAVRRGYETTSKNIQAAGSNMGAETYQVIYKGEILPGFDEQAVFQEVGKILSIREDIAAKILNGKRVVLKKGLDEATARSQCILLKKAGIRVALGVPSSRETSSEPPAPPPTPPAAMTAPPSRPSIGVDFDGSATAKLDLGATAGTPKPSASPAPSRIPFEFKGNGSEYFRIWVVNILLSIVTLGIYSAWAKVRRKQYFYGNTRVNGAGFEYLGSPAKILKGRLIIGGLLVITGAASHFYPMIHFPLVLVLGVFAPWLITRSLMFNAHNSAWRNIRFGFKAGYGQAFKAYVLWPVLAVLTLGCLSPYAYCRQKKFLVENSSFGKTAFTFSASWKDYYRILMVASLIGILAVAAVVGAAVLFAPLAILALPIYLYVYAYYAVHTGNLLYNASRLGRHRLLSTMEVKSFMMLVLTNTIATALTVGLFHPWAKVRTMRYKAQHLALIAAGDLNTFAAEKQKEVGAIGDASSDFFDFDLGL